MTGETADPVLQALIVHGRTVPTPVTLLVGGAVITGTLAPTSAYFRGVAVEALESVDWAMSTPNAPLIRVHESLRDGSDDAAQDTADLSASAREALGRLATAAEENRQRAAEQVTRLRQQAARDADHAEGAAARTLDNEDHPSFGRASFLNLTGASYRLAGGQPITAGAGGHLRVRTSAVDAWFPGLPDA